jgi:hypothetical protein
MARFPVDAPKRRVIKALEQLGFRMVRDDTKGENDEQAQFPAKTLPLLYYIVIPKHYLS